MAGSVAASLFARLTSMMQEAVVNVQSIVVIAVAMVELIGCRLISGFDSRQWCAV